MLTTFFSEPTTQSNTAFNFGIRLIVFNGRNTRSTRKIFIVALKTAKIDSILGALKKHSTLKHLQKWECKAEQCANHNDGIHNVPKVT